MEIGKEARKRDATMEKINQNTAPCKLWRYLKGQNRLNYVAKMREKCSNTLKDFCQNCFSLHNLICVGTGSNNG